MEYVVAVDFFYNQEFGLEFEEGQLVEDGQIEPDLIANLLTAGVLEPVPDLDVESEDD